MIYVKTIQKFIDKFDIKGISHITGGGIAENLSRILPKNAGAEILLDKLDFHKKIVFSIGFIKIVNLVKKKC